MNRNRKSRNTARLVNDVEAGQDPVFKAVLIYENVAAGARARWFLERLARASGKTLEEQMWNLDVRARSNERFSAGHFQTATVTRRNVAGIEVAFLSRLLFSRLNSSSSSFCKSPARPFFSAASNALMVGP